MRIVCDTNVLVSALRSRSGASFALFQLIPDSRFQIVLTVPLYSEYLDVTSRDGLLRPPMTSAVAREFCQFLASTAHLQEVYYLWRPFLSDPKDDMVLEAAVAGGARWVVTHNLGDFRGAPAFGVSAISPSSFLQQLNTLP